MAPSLLETFRVLSSFEPPRGKLRGAPWEAYVDWAISQGLAPLAAGGSSGSRCPGLELQASSTRRRACATESRSKFINAPEWTWESGGEFLIRGFFLGRVRNRRLARHRHGCGSPDRQTPGGLEEVPPPGAARSAVLQSLDERLILHDSSPAAFPDTSLSKRPRRAFFLLEQRFLPAATSRRPGRSEAAPARLTPSPCRRSRAASAP